MIGPDSADGHSVSGTSSTSSESSSEPTSSASSVVSANDGKEDAQSNRVPSDDDEGSDDCDEEVRSLDTGALSDLSDDVDMDEFWGEDEDRRDLEKAGRLFGLSMPYEKQLVTLSHES